MSKSKTEKDEIPMNRSHPKWTEYIISDLMEDEMFDGIPKTEAFRRLVEKFISPITNTDVDIQLNNASCLTVVATARITLENGQTYTACSDASMWNASGDFKNRLTPLADTRAKGKCYREILGVKNIFSVEEANNPTDPEDDSPAAITQVRALMDDCKKLDIDYEKAIRHFILGFESNRGVEKLKMSQAIELMANINDIKHDRKECPEEIKKEK